MSQISTHANLEDRLVDVKPMVHYVRPAAEDEDLEQSPISEGIPATVSKAELVLMSDVDGGWSTEEDAIRLRAYHYWQERGCPVGSPELDWLRAVQEEEWLRAAQETNESVK